MCVSSNFSNDIYTEMLTWKIVLRSILYYVYANQLFNSKHRLWTYDFFNWFKGKRTNERIPKIFENGKLLIWVVKSFFMCPIYAKYFWIIACQKYSRLSEYWFCLLVFSLHKKKLCMFIETWNSAFDFVKSNCPFVCLTNHNRKVWKNNAINDIVYTYIRF